MNLKIHTWALALSALIMMTPAGCNPPSKDEPDNPEEESKAAVYTASITLTGDTDLFLCNGSFFALPTGATDLYDADSNELALKNGIHYANDMGSLTIRTSDKAEYFCGRMACVIKDVYAGTLVVKLDLRKNDKALFSKQYTIPSSKVGASLFFESDKNDVSFELMSE